MVNTSSRDTNEIKGKSVFHIILPQLNVMNCTVQLPIVLIHNTAYPRELSPVAQRPNIVISKWDGPLGWRKFANS